MALATRCPHCQTAFRVASDQLKLRAGLVRCGTCKEIFNGIENLLHPDEDIVAATAAPTPPIPTIDDAVAASRRVRGDETRYNDLIAEVDRPDVVMPKAAAAAVANPAHVALVLPASLSTFSPVIDDRPTSVELDSTSLWKALDDPEADAQPGLATGAEAEQAGTAPPSADALDEAEHDPIDGNRADVDAVERNDHQESQRDDGIDTDVDDDADIRADTADPDPAETAAHDIADQEIGQGAPSLPRLLRTEAVGDAPPSDASTALLPGSLPTTLTGKLKKPPGKASDSTTTESALADHLPDFVAREEAREDRYRARRPLLITAAILLTLALLAQGIYAGRTALAASFAPLRPVLEQACKAVGCMVGLPMQIESVSIESSDFQPLPDRPDQFLLSVLLRNRGSTVQAWPTIELTLNDATDKAVGRRLITPRDYLPTGQTAVRGFGAGSEQPLRLVFDLSRLKAAGYRVYLFYP